MQWVNRWNIWIAPQPELPGVFRRRDGGYFARGTAVCQKTGREKEVKRSFPDSKTAQEARERLDALLDAVRNGSATAKPQRMRFSEYAALFVERRSTIVTRKRGWKSQATKHVVVTQLTSSIIPVFGDHWIDAITSADIEAWQAAMAKQIANQKLSPRTANDRIKIIRQVFGDAVRELKLTSNPVDGLEPFDESEHPTYSREQPNALTVEELQTFLATVKLRFPKYYAVIALGFATGLRPSSLRPLRWKGEESDIDLEQGLLFVRRSNAIGQAVMRCTKTGTQYTIALPREMVQILEEHIATIPEETKQRSDLLFPGHHGFQNVHAIWYVFKQVCQHLGLKKKLTPRAMRRTFQDLARSAQINNIVTRSISGHATEEMQRWYSTVHDEEQRAGLARIIELAKVRESSDRLHEPSALAVANETR